MDDETERAERELSEKDPARRGPRLADGNSNPHQEERRPLAFFSRIVGRDARRARYSGVAAMPPSRRPRAAFERRSEKLRATSG